jgi:hypothetical protein
MIKEATTGPRHLIDLARTKNGRLMSEAQSSFRNGRRAISSLKRCAPAGRHTHKGEGDVLSERGSGKKKSLPKQCAITKTHTHPHTRKDGVAWMSCSTVGGCGGGCGCCRDAAGGGNAGTGGAGPSIPAVEGGGGARCANAALLSNRSAAAAADAAEGGDDGDGGGAARGNNHGDGGGPAAAAFTSAAAAAAAARRVKRGATMAGGGVRPPARDRRPRGAPDEDRGGRAATCNDRRDAIYLRLRIYRHIYRTMGNEWLRADIGTCRVFEQTDSSALLYAASYRYILLVINYMWYVIAGVNPPFCCARARVGVTLPSPGEAKTGEQYHKSTDEPLETK